MTNERKMLDHAAKACGFHLSWMTNGKAAFVGDDIWTPLTDSADCAAMCAKLRIETLWSDLLDFVECSHDDVFYQAFNKDHNKDDEAAWRYAATMVCAKIGGYEE